MAAMTPSEFDSLADAALERVFDAVEDSGSHNAEVDIEGSVLTLEIDGTGTYILNKHAPMQQLWLSSPRSGAHHFAWDGARWGSTRGPVDLMTLLSAELEAALGVPVGLE